MTATTRTGVRTGARTVRTPAVPRSGGRAERPPERTRHEPDYPLVLAVVALVAIGVLVVYSSSAIRIALDPGGDLVRSLLVELGWVAFGATVCVFLSFLDYRHLRAASVPLMGVALLLLILVLLPPIGPIQPIESGGAARWLKIGPLPQLHPAELGKLALLVYLAHWLARRGTRVRELRAGFLAYWAIAGTVIGLVLLEPDLGTAGVIGFATLCLFLVAGGLLRYVVLAGPFVVMGVVLYVQSNPYQLERVTTYLDPWSVALQQGFHTVQGLYALALGGLLGSGLGQSRAPGGLYLPNADNDYIFAMVGQEFGLVGGLIVIGLFLFFGYRGLRVAMSAADPFGMLLATGITTILFIQAFLNIGVVVNLLPVTGITLPFISSGGTSLVVSLAAVGILLSVSRETVTGDVTADADPDRGGRHGRAHLPRPRRPSLPRRRAA
ncbi:MAG: FtsW/RodA/SpoVE family cell cycle protein [Chloroflexota bacterium]